jgi:hypothetical protein
VARAADDDVIDGSPKDILQEGVQVGACVNALLVSNLPLDFVEWAFGQQCMDFPKGVSGEAARSNRLLALDF